MLMATLPHPDFIHIYPSQSQQEDLGSELIKGLESKEQERREEETGGGEEGIIDY